MGQHNACEILEVAQIPRLSFLVANGLNGWLGDSPVVRRNHSIAVLPLSLNEPGDVYYAASLYRLTLIVSHRMPLEANGQYLAYFGVCQS